MAVESDSEVASMLCSICKGYNTRNKYNQSTLWSATPCSCLRKNSLRCHAKSTQHVSAVELEIHRVAAERNGGIA